MQSYKYKSTTPYVSHYERSMNRCHTEITVKIWNKSPKTGAYKFEADMYDHDLLYETTLTTSAMIDFNFEEELRMRYDYLCGRSVPMDFVYRITAPKREVCEIITKTYSQAYIDCKSFVTTEEVCE